MATFTRATFNTAQYAAARPTYPKQLYDFVFRYHERAPGARWDTALDLGCGTGQATVELTPFKKIIGADPSAMMVEQAKEQLARATDDIRLGLKDRVTFVQSKAEELGWLESGSVDLIVAAQAAHWFDWNKLWPEAARVLRKNGTLAVWGYSEFRVSSHPSCTPLIHAYAQGSDPTASIGPHWERPGRTILDDHLRPIPDPDAVCKNGEWAESQRTYFVGAHHPTLPNPLPVLLRKKTTWAGVLDYLRTFSALHTFHERFPEDLQRADGDIAVRFWHSLRAQVAEDNGLPSGELEGAEDEVTLEWPLAVITARKA